MRLADQIEVVARDPRHPLREDYARMAEAIRAGLRLEITPAAGKVAGNIGQSDATWLREVRGLAKAPAPMIWVEWQGVSNAFYGLPAEPSPGQMMPDRCGFLIETEPCGQRGLVSQSWCARIQGQRVALETSPLCVTFDFSRNRRPVPSLMGRDPSVPRFPGGTPRTPWEKRLAQQIESLTPAEIEEEMRCIGFVTNQRMKRLQETLDAAARVDPIGNMMRAHVFTDDWNGELNFLMALLLCLNTPDLVRIGEPEDMSVLNATRRRLGRPPLLPFAPIEACEVIA